jgi:prepilin peptidase CpaA
MDLGIAKLLAFGCLALFGAYKDIRFRTIPNSFNVGLAIAGVAATWITAGDWATVLSIAHFAAALVLGMLLYDLGMWGGGDAKFYAASAAWFSLWDFVLLAVAISLAGFFLLIVWLVALQIRGRPTEPKGKMELPYGVAIAVGGLAAFAWQT